MFPPTVPPSNRTPVIPRNSFPIDSWSQWYAAGGQGLLPPSLSWSDYTDWCAAEGIEPSTSQFTQFQSMWRSPAFRASFKVAAVKSGLGKVLDASSIFNAMRVVYRNPSANIEEFLHAYLETSTGGRILNRITKNQPPGEVELPADASIETLIQDLDDLTPNELQNMRVRAQYGQGLTDEQITEIEEWENIAAEDAPEAQESGCDLM